MVSIDPSSVCHDAEELYILEHIPFRRRGDMKCRDVEYKQPQL